MKSNKILVFCLLLLCAARVCAQGDSVVVMGTVVDHLSGEPQPYSLLHFIQGSDTAATVRCDGEGYFLTDPMAAGAYTLCVTLKGQVVYRSDLVLNDNAALHIAVITDSFQLRTLREVEIVALKHALAQSGLLITTPDEPRLWDFTFCDWCLWGLPPRVVSASTSGDPNNPEGHVKSGRFYHAAKRAKDDRLWQILWPDRTIPADTTKKH